MKNPSLELLKVILKNDSVSVLSQDGHTIKYGGIKKGLSFNGDISTLEIIPLLKEYLLQHEVWFNMKYYLDKVYLSCKGIQTIQSGSEFRNLVTACEIIRKQYLDNDKV